MVLWFTMTNTNQESTHTKPKRSTDSCDTTPDITAMIELPRTARQNVPDNRLTSKPRCK